jgi:hypothetical protein
METEQGKRAVPSLPGSRVIARVAASNGMLGAAGTYRAARNGKASAMVSAFPQDVHFLTADFLMVQAFSGELASKSAD